MSLSHGDSLAEAAVGYLEMGFPVIPLCPPNHLGVSDNHKGKCQNPGKAPLINNWQQYAKGLPSKELVANWWASWPSANLGGPTGPLWGLALDIDPRHDGDLQVGGPDRPITDTVTNLTGGGGTHHLFCWPTDLEVGNRVGLFPGVDVRGLGGQIVLPPSVHLSGRRYEWEGGFEPRQHPFAQPPAWLMEALIGDNRKDQVGRVNYIELLSGVSEGRRNDSAARLAGRYLHKGLSGSEVLDLLCSWNQRNHPPMAHAELSQIIQSIASRNQTQEREISQLWQPRRLLADDEVDEACSLNTWTSRFLRYASQRTDAPLAFLEAAAIAAISAAVGRKPILSLTTSLVIPTIWVMLVADSTRYRKSTVIDLAADVLRLAELNVFAPDDFSPQRFISLMSERSGMPTLFCRDEFGGFYEGLNKLEHQAGGKQVLISMHDGRNYRKELVGLKQIDKESGDLTRTPEVIEAKDPFLSILAGTQRDLFLSQAQPGDVFSGFLPRFGLIVPDGLRNRQDVLEMTPAIEAQRYDLVTEVRNIFSQPTRTMRLGTGVLERWNNYSSCLEEEAEAAPLPSIAGPVFDRMGGTALKLALISAFCDGDVVSMAHLLAGIEVSERWRVQTYNLLASIGPSRDEKVVQRILDLVRRKPGIKRRDVMSSLRLSAKEMDGAHATLMQRESLRIEEQGRATCYYPGGHVDEGNA